MKEVPVGTCAGGAPGGGAMGARLPAPLLQPNPTQPNPTQSGGSRQGQRRQSHTQPSSPTRRGPSGSQPHQPQWGGARGRMCKRPTCFLVSGCPGCPRPTCTHPHVPLALLNLTGPTPGQSTPSYASMKQPKVPPARSTAADMPTSPYRMMRSLGKSSMHRSECRMTSRPSAPTANAIDCT